VKRNKTKKKRLQLAKQTVRKLSKDKLQQIQGGMEANTFQTRLCATGA
jgi:bacteriocin-like protein